jgi:DNA-binding NtrC family response regulator
MISSVWAMIPSDGSSDDDDYGEEASTLGIERSQTRAGNLIVRVIGDGLYASHPLPPRREIMIGRSQKADVRIDHPSISRQHAVLHPGPPLRLQDLGSANGTRVGERQLAAGETVSIGLNEAIELGTVLMVVQPGELGDAPRPVREATMAQLGRVIERVAAGTISVLLLGETGVGKEVMAERLHKLSPRAKKPFLQLNCGALPENLLESELFGHVKGAFTGALQNKPGLLETAQGGTVFLDEVGELPPAIQVKLLRVLEARQVQAIGGLSPRAIDVRFIAATNRDLPAEVARGAFRQDLYFRLNGISLTIPPLRERVSEIDGLAAQFLAQALAQSTPPRALKLSSEVLAGLRRYAWPGNVRELRNVIERAVLLCAGDVIELEHLSLPASSPLDPLRAQPQAVASSPERQRILDALAEAAGNQKLAAQKLGISRGTLVSRLDEYGIPRPRKR